MLEQSVVHFSPYDFRQLAGPNNSALKDVTFRVEPNGLIELQE